MTLICGSTRVRTVDPPDTHVFFENECVGVLWTAELYSFDKVFYSGSRFPALDLPFKFIRFWFRLERFLKDNHPVFCLCRKPRMICQMISKPLFSLQFSMAYVIGIEISWIKDVRMRHILKKAISNILMTSSCGSTRVRTADPLLVRQMLWTSWAMLPMNLF